MHQAGTIRFSVLRVFSSPVDRVSTPVSTKMFYSDLSNVSNRRKIYNSVNDHLKQAAVTISSDTVAMVNSMTPFHIRLVQIVLVNFLQLIVFGATSYGPSNFKQFSPAKAKFWESFSEN